MCGQPLLGVVVAQVTVEDEAIARARANHTLVPGQTANAHFVHFQVVQLLLGVRVPNLCGKIRIFEKTKI